MRADGSSCGGAGGCGCDTCGEANNSVGAQALAWAMQVQSPAARADRFWGPLALADAPLRAISHDAASAATGDAVMESLRAHVELHGSAPWLHGDGAVLDVHLPIQMNDSPPQGPPGAVPEFLLPFGPLGDPLWRVRNPSPDLGPGGTVYQPKVIGAECCPKEFMYPDSVLGIVGKGGAAVDGTPATGTIERQFTWSAEFWPTSDTHPKCDCLCCTFRHYVFESQPNAKVQGRDTKVLPPAPGEDFCEWHVVGPATDEDRQKDPKVGFFKGKRVMAPRSQPPSQPDGGFVFGPICYGDHFQPGGPAGIFGEPAPEYTPADTGAPDHACKFNSSDNPRVPVWFPGTFEWTWESWGVIYDRCNGYAIKRAARLTWRIVGSTGANGTVTVKSDAWRPTEFKVR